MKHDAIIFDIDGTLWNASQASAIGWNNGLAKLNIDLRVTVAQIEGVAGNPYEKCIDILLPGLREQYPGLSDTLNSCEIEVVKAAGGNFYEGVLEGINTLADSYRIFLVSNCQDWYMKLFLQFSGLEPILAGYDCHGMSGQPKHEMFAGLISRFGLKHPVYVGDTDGDQKAARLAGIDFIHAAYGFGSPGNNSASCASFPAVVAHLQNAKQ
ncbi:MAG TPA: HAD family hydrolase [Candidatus Riflebacteria bacterium]|jgi:phosphoglycolate phosphatase|nr:HAD family hydrolase [Candidatus Riflebacteria bacterium]